MTAPQPSHTSKELETEILNELVNLDGNQYGHPYSINEAWAKILGFVKAHEAKTLKKISDLYGISLPELEKNLAHYKGDV